MWTIRQAQMDALADDTFEQVVARVSAAIARNYPEVWLALGDAGFATWVREHLMAATTLDLTLEENLYRFVAWSARLGLETTLADEYPWAIEMLGVADEDETTRVEAVELRMQGLDEEP